MKIEKATDYGSRKVIRVVMNDTDPQWVHPKDAGVAHRSNLARKATKADGTRGDKDSSLAAGTECHACVQNHQVQEFLYQGDTLLKLTDPDDSDSILIPKTDQDLKDEALASAATSMPSESRDMGK